MPLIGGRVNRLEAKRKEDKPLQELNLNIVIDKVEIEKKMLTVQYSCTAHYEPGIADITISGELMWEAGNDKQAKDMLEEYNRTRSLPADVAEDVVTAINYTTGAVGTLGAFALGITAPINTPRAKISKMSAPGSKAS